VVVAAAVGHATAADLLCPGEVAATTTTADLDPGVATPVEEEEIMATIKQR